ncbi:MAG: xylan 1,4-beta-xylosidase, partial [Bacteroidaceae bacterium]|nr:xylan 1,4-beta-xylosidase [Bacteroidaceae bacterium]
HLRLYTASVTDNLYQARNTLTQRILGCHHSDGLSYATIALNLSHMKNGDVAGLAVMQDPSAFIAIKQEGKKRYLVSTKLSLRHKSQEDIIGERIKSPIIYLRAITNYKTSKAHFYYSTDNKEYIPFGKELDMKFDLSVFTGNKFAIFNYATRELGGYVDIDWFSTEPEFSEDMFYDNEFKGYSEASLTLQQLNFTGQNPTTLVTGSTQELELIATYADGHSDNVASLATYSGYDKNVIQVVNGRISAINDGSTQLTATYKGARGNEHSQTISINATTFPLTAGAFNPSSWEHGTFDAKTSTVSTGRYGFAGWKYDNGLDISKHKYLIVEIEGGEGAQVSFRLFDQNNYWSDCATYDFGNSNNLVIPIDQIRRSKNPERAFATNHIYIIGFWSTGGKEFRIKNIELR